MIASNEQYYSHIICFEMYNKIQYEILLGANVGCSKLKRRGEINVLQLKVS